MLDFPCNASSGDTYQGWIWDGSKWVPKSSEDQIANLQNQIDALKTVQLSFIIPGIIAVSQAYNLPITIPLQIATSGGVGFSGTKQTATNRYFAVNKISGGVLTYINDIVSTTYGGFSLINLAGVQFAAGDVLQIVTPTTADTTFADVGISILATRV